ncbi:helix-turn-helix transcriptional regulator [Streptosporangiaceae bacterium NEAU-GS5]|nr:helix-turn-helix transcriptional regulator [Streptosporangiaceae bacterium NEAU-GS5]
MYAERRSRLAGSVVWTRPARPPREIRVLPDGCIDLIWDGSNLLVAGPDTYPHFIQETDTGGYVGLRFAPGTGPQVFGLPAYELKDERLHLDALWPAEAVRELEERVAEAGDAGRFLEDTALGRLAEAGADLFGGRVASALARGESVATVADRFGLSERQLHRRSLNAFGYGPKTLARILRMERALTLARRGTPFADVAATIGYADQAHLSREIKSLAGAPLSALL